MALDNLENIREYRERLNETADQRGGETVVAATADTMMAMLDTLLDEIGRLQKILDTGKTDGAVETLALFKKRQRRQRSDRLTQILGPEAPDLL